MDEEWKETYDSLVEFVEAHEKLPNLRSQKDSEKKIGTWAAEQRKNYKKKELDEEKVTLLEKIDKWFWISKNNSRNNARTKEKKEKIKEEYIEKRKDDLKDKDIEELLDMIVKLEIDKICLLA